jgi:hypothetical protein
MSDNNNPKANPRQYRLEVPSTLDPTYSNAVVINQTTSEIIFDFTQVMPNDPRLRVKQRVIMTPSNAKALLQALTAHMARFEEKHGEIKLPPTLADQLFGAVAKSEGDGIKDE